MSSHSKVFCLGDQQADRELQIAAVDCRQRYRERREALSGLTVFVDEWGAQE